MNEIDAAGDAVLGSALASTAEPTAGLAVDGHTAETACLNCGTELAGDYCHACGQRGHVHRTLRAFFNDLLHGVFHFEGKILRTLPLLVWRPGQLTRRYIDGERAKFVSPIALFLFVVFLMFAAFAVIGRSAYYVEPPTQQIRETSAGPIDMDLGDAPEPLKWLDAAYKKAKENPNLLAYKLQSNAYKFSWALIPISVPLVWLLFLHRPIYRRYKLYDHTIFVTYSIAFMSLFAIGYTLLKLGGLIGTVALLPFAIVPVHMYRQLRGAYALGRPSALWRTAALLVFALGALTAFLISLLLLGVLG